MITIEEFDVLVHGSYSDKCNAVNAYAKLVDEINRKNIPNKKYRSQLLMMAGNIACGFFTVAAEIKINEPGLSIEQAIAKQSAILAYETMKAVDKLIKDDK